MFVSVLTRTYFLLGPAPANTVVLYYTSFLSITSLFLWVTYFISRHTFCYNTRPSASVRFKSEVELAHKRNFGLVHKYCSDSIWTSSKSAANLSLANWLTLSYWTFYLLLFKTLTPESMFQDQWFIKYCQFVYGI